MGLRRKCRNVASAHGQPVELSWIDRTERGLDAEHLVVSTLALPVDAVGKSEDLEHVVIDLAGQV